MSTPIPRDKKTVLLWPGEFGNKLRQLLQEKIETNGYLLFQEDTEEKIDIIVSDQAIKRIIHQINKKYLNLIEKPCYLVSSKAISMSESLVSCGTDVHSIENKISKKRKYVNVEKEAYYQEYKLNGKKDMACKRKATIQHLNHNLASMFSELLKLQECDVSDQQRLGKCLAYERALSIIRAWPKRINLSNYQFLMEAHKFGSQSLEKVKSFLETGTCPKQRRLKSNNNIIAISELSGVYGIGIKKAEELVNAGIKSVQDLTHSLHSRNINISKGTRFALEKGSTAELSSWTTTVAHDICDDLCESFSSLDDFEVTVHLVGGFLRGKQSGHDLDLLISWKKEPFEKVALLSTAEYEEIRQGEMSTLHTVRAECLAVLRKQFNVKVISNGVFNKEPQCCTSRTTLMFIYYESKWRRLDFFFVCPIALPFAILGYTGSKYFEKSIRGYARAMKNTHTTNERHFKLSSSSLHLFDTLMNKDIKRLVVRNEKDIFEFMNLEYLKPLERCH